MYVMSTHAETGGSFFTRSLDVVRRDSGQCAPSGLLESGFAEAASGALSLVFQDDDETLQFPGE